MGYENTDQLLSRRVEPKLVSSVSISTSRPGSFTGSRRKATWYSSEKMAVLAPIPSVNDKTATRVKPGERRAVRRANRMSFHMVLARHAEAQFHNLSFQ